ncbi:MAG: alpha/beta hydrolase family protein, partial [Allosphingosinicella sp.]
GPFVRDEIEAARRAGSADRAQARLAQVLATDHMDDQAQAFGWLSRQPFVARGRIAVMGNSFGGIIALLSADKLDVCAAVDAAGGAESWGEAPALRALMTRAAARARAPVLFMQARNDFSVAPSRVLAAVRRQNDRPVELRLYPSFGNTPRDGHAFPYRGVAVWAADVRAFLVRACP